MNLAQAHFQSCQGPSTVKSEIIVGVAIGTGSKYSFSVTANSWTSSKYCLTAHAQIGKPRPFWAPLAEMREIYTVMEGGMRVSMR